MLPSSGANARRHRDQTIYPYVSPARQSRRNPGIWTVKASFDPAPRKKTRWFGLALGQGCEQMITLGGQSVTLRTNLGPNGEMFYTLGFTSDPSGWLNLGKVSTFLKKYTSA